jgi:hypothetical protein
MISAVVQKLRIIQAVGCLVLRLLRGSGERRGCGSAGVKDVSERYYDHEKYQRELEVFHSYVTRLCPQSRHSLLAAPKARNMIAMSKREAHRPYV